MRTCYESYIVPTERGGYDQKRIGPRWPPVHLPVAVAVRIELRGMKSTAGLSAPHGDASFDLGLGSHRPDLLHRFFDFLFLC